MSEAFQVDHENMLRPYLTLECVKICDRISFFTGIMPLITKGEESVFFLKNNVFVAPATNVQTLVG